MKLSDLSERQQEVVKLAASGLRDKEIATQLDIGEGTVKSHLQWAYRKTGVTTRIALLHHFYDLAEKTT